MLRAHFVQVFLAKWRAAARSIVVAEANRSKVLDLPVVYYNHVEPSTFVEKLIREALVRVCSYVRGVVSGDRCLVGQSIGKTACKLCAWSCRRRLRKGNDVAF